MGWTSGPSPRGAHTPGRPGQAVQEHLGEQPRDLGQGQAEEIRVKTHGRIVWMALAMRVRTRVGLAGEVSAPRDRPLIRRLIERVRRCAAHRPLWVGTDGCWQDGSWLDRPGTAVVSCATASLDPT